MTFQTVFPWILLALIAFGVVLPLWWLLLRNELKFKEWLRETAARAAAVGSEFEFIKILTGGADYASRKDSASASNREFASNFYRAYIVEILRLAGINPQKFLADNDLKNGDVVLQLLTAAEGYLLLSIVEQLTGRQRPDLPHGVPPDRSMSPKEWYKSYSPTPHSVARKLADDAEVWNYALLMLKKINPVLQQVAGSMVLPQASPTK